MVVEIDLSIQRWEMWGIYGERDKITRDTTKRPNNNAMSISCGVVNDSIKSYSRLCRLSSSRRQWWQTAVALSSLKLKSYANTLKNITKLTVVLQHDEQASRDNEQHTWGQQIWEMLENVFAILELYEGDERGCEKNCSEQRQINPNHELIVQLPVYQWQEEDVTEAESGW